MERAHEPHPDLAELATLIGVPRESASPSMLLPRIHPADRDRIQRLLRSQRQHPHAESVECRVLRTDGATRILASRLEPIGSDGSLLVGLVWDITEQHRAPSEANLKPLLRSTLEATADGILVVDRTGHIVTYNQRFVAMWHIPEAIVRQRDDETLLHRVLTQLDDPDAFLAKVRTLYGSPERESFDVLHFKDGRVFERYSRPQRQLEFAIVGRVWSFRDVTERERLIAQTSFRLDVSRMLISLDVRTALGAIAEAALHQLGDACAIDVFGDPDPHPTVARTRDGKPSVPAVPDGVRDRRSVMTDRDGDAILAVPLTHHDDVVGAILVSRPSTRPYSRAQLELLQRVASDIVFAIENDRLLRETRSALRTRDEFISIAAHELRGPVQAIQLAAGALQQPALPEATRARALKLVERQAQRLTQFAAELADVTRVHEGVLNYHDEDVDLVDVVNGSKARLALDLQRSGSVLAITAPVTVIGRWDRERMAQVVFNLLSNAIKFGLGKPIDIALEASAGWATLIVRDHGLGISPAKREQIFSPFERAVSPRHYGGLGLGLFIVRAIVGHYGGTVVVEPTDGDGSRFVVRIPQARTT